jgi:hypothetical protein
MVDFVAKCPASGMGVHHIALPLKSVHQPCQGSRPFECGKSRLSEEYLYFPTHGRGFYWLAVARPADPWHAAVWQWAGANAATRIFTTYEVLTEFLNALAGTGPAGRAYAAATIRDIRNHLQVDVLPQSRADFDAALALYESRPDKGTA